MPSLADDFRAWHQRHFPEWYKVIPTLPIFDERGHLIGHRLVEDPSLCSRDAEFEALMARLTDHGIGG